MKSRLERIINASPSVGDVIKSGIVTAGLALAQLPQVAGAMSGENTKKNECDTTQAKIYYKDIVDDYLNDVLVKVLDEYSETPLGQATVKITALGQPEPLHLLDERFEKDLKKYPCFGRYTHSASEKDMVKFVLGRFIGTENPFFDSEDIFCGNYVSEEYEFTGDWQSTQFRVYLDPNVCYQIECTRGAPGVLEREWAAEDGTHRSDTRGDNQRYRPARGKFYSGGKIQQLNILMSNDREIDSVVKIFLTTSGLESKPISAWYLAGKDDCFLRTRLP